VNLVCFAGSLSGLKSRPALEKNPRAYTWFNGIE
jgi:hypothetical protein